MNYLRLFFLCFFYSVAFSQSNKQIAFRELTVEQGLSQNSVVSIAQDSIGFMWFATQDGLNKYDGREFIHYDIQFEDVTRSTYSKLGKIYVDKSGLLWVVSNARQLEYYQKETDDFQKVSNVGQVSTLIQDAAQNYYLGTYQKGIFKIHHQTKDTLQLLKPEDAHRTVYDFLETKNNTILAATNGGIIEIRNKDYKFAEIIPGTNFSALTTSKNNTLFLGSYGEGLFVKLQNDANFKPFKGFMSHSLPKNLIIQDVLVDKRNRLWIATYGKGVFLVDFSLETIQNFTENKNDPYALHYNDVLSLYEDNTGTIWLGTDGSGLSYYDEYLVKFNVLTNDQVPQNVNVDVIRAITIDENNSIWLGTSGKGLTRINTDNQAFFTYTATNSKLLGDRIMSLLYDDGNLWIGHQTNGLQLMGADGKITSYKETEEFTIWKIFKDTSGNMWLCTRDHGLVTFDENVGFMKQFSAENSNLTTNNIRTIAQGDANTLWVGTESDGLYKLTIDEAKLSKIDNIANKIKSLFYEEGILWVGTNGEGLKSYAVDNKSIATYTKKDGLPNDVVYGLLSDDDKNLWLSSNKGITKLVIENNMVSAIENYSNYDGLQAFEFNTGAYYKDKNGILYFGGLEGLNWFDPNQLEINPIKPRTVISGFEVFNKERKLYESQNLNHNENTVTFSFSSLHFSQPERNQYKYRLINNDVDWISSGNTHVAHYTNLPPNDYEFQVISSNYDGVWNNEPAKYAFTILKPWYATNLAKALYLLLGLALVLLLYKYLKWRWQMKMHLQFEHEETERLQKLNDFKSNLYTNIAHEFKTPLTLIAGPVEQKLQEVDISASDRTNFSMVKRNTKRLTALVDQILDLAKMENEKLQLQLSKGNLGLFLHTIAQSFDYQADFKNIDYTVKIQSIDNAVYDEDIIEKITTNLLSNAFKYCPENGRCSFSVTKHAEHIYISVKNTIMNGTKLNLEKLFTRFYQYDNYAEGMGVGLSLVKELVAFYEGKIHTRMELGEIIHFELELPLKQYLDGDTIIKEYKVPVIENKNTTVNTLINSKVTPDDSLPILLIVEDYAEIRAFIKNALKGKYHILEAENGKQGLKISMSKIPDIIISDIRMPVLDGIQLCDTLKNNDLTNHIPIILLTANSEEENELKGLASGADDFVIKPFKIHLLEQRIDNLIEVRKALRNRYSQELILKPKNITITPIEESFLNKIQEILDLYLTDPRFNAELFSKKIGMSRMQLHRKLLSYTGLSTSAFIRSQRLKQALHLLKTSDSTINEIAYAVGFNTPSYFMKCFKETFKKTPSEYSQYID